MGAFFLFLTCCHWCSSLKLRHNNQEDNVSSICKYLKLKLLWLPQQEELEIKDKNKSGGILCIKSIWLCGAFRVILLKLSIEYITACVLFPLAIICSFFLSPVNLRMAKFSWHLFKPFHYMLYNALRALG